MTEPTTHTFASDDGVTLAYHEVGSERPVLLLHGYISAQRRRRAAAQRGAAADHARHARPR